VVLATAVAVCFSAFAGAASAKKYSAKQKAQIRKSLKKQIKKNPAVIKRKSFVRRAALVNFVLPVTIRLRTACTTPQTSSAAGNCTALNEQDPVNTGSPSTWRGNFANVDLGPSLGQRQIALSGSLAAEVQFNDTYDGGALGNVGIKILPGAKQLSSSSVPLLWNPDVTTTAGTRSDANFARAAVRAGSALTGLLNATGISGATQGCGDFNNNVVGARTIGAVSGQGTYSALWYNGLGQPTPPNGLGAPTGGLPGYPVMDPAVDPTYTTPAYFLPIFAGIDDPNNVTGGTFATGSNNSVGPNQNPFPYTNNTAPGGASYNAADTVLRTNALQIGIAPAGVTVDGATGTSVSSTPGDLGNGPQGTQSFITGQSGGQANLFGNIPGKSDSIDVTVNLATKINSIIRIVDQDVFDTPLVSGQTWPAGIFNCRQIWTGAVQNYIPGVRLKGSLRVAPAITKDGKLRIAKATVKTSQDTHVALSACLMPYATYGDDNGSYSGSTATAPAKVRPVPFDGGAATVSGTAAVLPTQAEAIAGGIGVGAITSLVQYNNTALPFVNSPRAVPNTVTCNSAPTPLVANSGLTGNVAPQTGASGDGYTTTATGAQATVAGDITVPNLSVDVLIGDDTP